MNTARKIDLDRRVFGPVARALNGIVRLLGILLRRDHSVTDANVRTIVLSKFVGMGSLVQSTVLLRSLRCRYPNARILYFTLAGNAELCRRLPGVDDVVTFDDRTVSRAALTVIPALWKLARRRADLYFDLEVYSHVASVLCTLSLARNRYGFFRQSCDFKQGLYTHLLYLNCFRHITDAFGQLARLVDAEPDPRLLAPVLSDAEHAAARAFLDRLELTPKTRLLAVNANASDLLLERRWPAASFARLIDELIRRESDVRIILIGSPEEREYLEREVLARCSPETRQRVAMAAGALSLFETMALLTQCHALLTNDSGPMHFAFALGVPTIALFGPGLPAHYGPLPGMKARVLYQGIYCSPCLYHTEPPPCRGDNQCMQQIAVPEVLDAVAGMLGFKLPAALPVCPSPNGTRGTLGVVLRPPVRSRR